MVHTALSLQLQDLKDEFVEMLAVTKEYKTRMTSLEKKINILEAAQKKSSDDYIYSTKNHTDAETTEYILQQHNLSQQIQTLKKQQVRLGKSSNELLPFFNCLRAMRMQLDGISFQYPNALPQESITQFKQALDKITPAHLKTATPYIVGVLSRVKTLIDEHLQPETRNLWSKAVNGYYAAKASVFNLTNSIAYAVSNLWSNVNYSAVSTEEKSFSSGSVATILKGIDFDPKNPTHRSTSTETVALTNSQDTQKIQPSKRVNISELRRKSLSDLSNDKKSDITPPRSHSFSG